MNGLYPNDASMIDSAGRLLIVALFVVLGIRNLQKHQIEDHIQRIAMGGFPLPRAAFWIGTVLEVVGCTLLLANWHPAIGVICLLIFTVVAAFLLQRFWEAADPAKRTAMQNGFMANVAITGGLLLLLQNVR